MPTSQGRHVWKDRTSPSKRQSSSSSSSSTATAHAQDTNILTVGKLKDTSFGDIFTTEREYCDWVVTLKDPSGPMQVFQQYIVEKRGASSSSGTSSNKRQRTTKTKQEIDDMNMSQEVKAERRQTRDFASAKIPRAPPSAGRDTPRDTSGAGSSENIDVREKSQALQAAKCIVYALEQAKISNDTYRIRNLNWLVRNREKWTCQQATEGSGKEKRNVDIAVHFDEVADAYLAAGGVQAHWREGAFRK